MSFEQMLDDIEFTDDLFLSFDFKQKMQGVQAITKNITDYDSIYSKEKIIFDQLTKDIPNDKLNTNVINNLTKKANNIVKLIELSKNESFNFDLKQENPFRFNLENNINDNMNYVTLSKINIYPEDSYLKIQDNINVNPIVLSDKINELIDFKTSFEKTNFSIGGNNQQIKIPSWHTDTTQKNDSWKTFKDITRAFNEGHTNDLQDLENINLSYFKLNNEFDRHVKYIKIDYQDNIVYNKVLNKRLTLGNVYNLVDIYEDDVKKIVNNKNNIKVCNGTSKNDRAFSVQEKDNFNKSIVKPPKEELLYYGDNINVVGLSFKKELPSFFNNSKRKIRICNTDAELFFSNNIRSNNISDYKKSKYINENLASYDEDITTDHYSKIFTNDENLKQLTSSELEKHINDTIPNNKIDDIINKKNIYSLNDLNNELKNLGLSDLNLNQNQKMHLYKNISKNIKNKENILNKAVIHSKNSNYHYKIINLIDNNIINKVKELIFNKDENIILNLNDFIKKIFNLYGYIEGKESIIMNKFIDHINKNNKKQIIIYKGNYTSSIAEYYYYNYNNTSFNNLHYLTDYRRFLSNNMIDDLLKNVIKHYPNLPLQNRHYKGFISNNDQLNIDLLSSLENSPDNNDLLNSVLKLIELYKNENELNEEIDILAHKSYLLVNEIDDWDKLDSEEKNTYLSSENINNLYRNFESKINMFVDEIKKFNFFENHCSKFKIVKIYDNINKLRNDNNIKDVFIDDEFDNVNKIIKIYNNQLKNIKISSPEISDEDLYDKVNKNVIDEIEKKYKFLTENMQQYEQIINEIGNRIENSQPLNDLRSLVSNGSYALLLDESKKILYKRVGLSWFPLNKEDIISSLSLCEQNSISITDTEYDSFEKLTSNKCLLKKTKEGSYCIPKEIYNLYEDINKNKDSMNMLKDIDFSIQNIDNEKNILIEKIKYFSDKLLFKKTTSFIESQDIVIDDIISPPKYISDELNEIFNIQDEQELFTKLKDFYQKYGRYHDDEEKFIYVKDTKIPLLCKHYIDYTQYALSNDLENKNKYKNHIIFKWGTDDDTEFIHCNTCGVSLFRKDLIEIESFGDDNRPIQFRETIIEETKTDNPYNPKSDDHLIFEIMKIFSSQMNIKPKISDKRQKNIIHIVNNLKIEEDINFSKLLYFLFIGNNESDDIVPNLIPFNSELNKIKNMIYYQDKDFRNESIYTIIYKKYIDVFGSFTDNLRDVMKNINEDNLKEKTKNINLSEDKKQQIFDLIEILNKKLRLKRGVNSYRDIITNTLNWMENISLQYNKFILILKTIIVFTHEIYYYKPDGSHYEIIASGTEHLSRGETFVNIKDGTYDTIWNTVFTMYDKTFSKQTGSIFDYTILLGNKKLFNDPKSVTKNMLVKSINNYIQLNTEFKELIGMRQNNEPIKMTKKQKQLLYIKEWQSFKPRLTKLDEIDITNSENNESNLINDIKKHTRNYITQLDNLVDQQEKSRSIITYKNITNIKNTFNHDLDSGYFQNIDFLNKQIKQIKTSGQRLITYDENDTYLNQDIFNINFKLTYKKMFKLLKTYVYENTKNNGFGKKRVYKKMINYDLESFKDIEKNIYESKDLYSELKMKYFEFLDEEYPQLFQDTKKQQKYYKCINNLFIYNLDTITGNTEYELNMLISCLLYNELYNQNADDDDYEKLYQDIIDMTKQKQLNCNQKYDIYSELFVSNNTLKRVVEFFNNDYDDFNKRGYEGNELYTNLMKVLDLNYYHEAVIFNNFMNNKQPLNIVVKNLLDVINDNNLGSHIEDDQFNNDNNFYKKKVHNINNYNINNKLTQGNNIILMQEIVNMFDDSLSKLELNQQKELAEKAKYEVEVATNSLTDKMESFLNQYMIQNKIKYKIENIGLSKKRKEEEIDEIDNLLNIEGYYSDRDRKAKRIENINNMSYIDASTNFKEYILLINYLVELINNSYTNGKDITLSINDKINEKDNYYLFAWASENRDYLKNDVIISKYKLKNFIRQIDNYTDPNTRIFNGYSPIIYDDLKIFNAYISRPDEQKNHIDPETLYKISKCLFYSQLISIINCEETHVNLKNDFFIILMETIITIDNIRTNSNNTIKDIIDKKKSKKNRARLLSAQRRTDEEILLHRLYRGSNLGKFSSTNLDKVNDNIDEDQELVMEQGEEDDEAIAHNENTELPAIDEQDIYEGLITDEDLIENDQDIFMNISYDLFQ